MSENMNVEAAAIAVRKNKKWFVGGGSGGTTIHYYDSIDEVPADLPEGSFVAVPSEDDTKVIDLTQYSFSDGITFNDAILQMFAAGGGGKGPHEVTGDFWGVVASAKFLKVALDASQMSEGIKIESKVISTTKSYDYPCGIETSFITVLGTTVYRVSIIFVMIAISTDITGTSIMVKVDEITIPNVG